MKLRFVLPLLVVLLVSVAKTAETDLHYSMMDGVGRGIANLLTGWIELPRGMTYYGVEWPGIGIIPGAMQGAGMTGVRLVGGLLDLLTLGYFEPGYTVYDAMDEPLYPWEALWLPPKDAQ